MGIGWFRCGYSRNEPTITYLLTTLTILLWAFFNFLIQL